MGYAVMGTATASGKDRAIEAAERAIASPLLEAGAIDGARGILINITGSASLKLAEVHQACTIIQSAAHEDANIIFGAVMDEKMKDAVKITVIATGFRESERSHHRREEVHPSFATTNDDALRFPEPVMSAPAEEMPQDVEPMPIEERPAPAVSPFAAGHTGAEVITLDTMRNAMAANFEQDDLDVPAFMRKRGEVM